MNSMLLLRSIAFNSRVSARNLLQSLAISSRLFLSSPKNLQSDKAFVFDIDGVLLRGGTPIPQASGALKALRQAQIPFILMTNGGGSLEKARTEFLSSRLGIDISPHQIVQSHTPMKVWAQNGDFDRVLIVGGKDDLARFVAQDYGFKDVVLPMDIVRHTPSIAPHHRYSEEQLERMARPELDLSKKFDAILVFNDPRDMATDLQIVLDLLNSDNGVIGTRRSLDQWGEKPSVPIVFSNNDFEWANNYPLPRFGQGAFRMVVERIYKELNQLSGDQNLERLILGKPFKVQHDYAHFCLIDWNNRIHGINDSKSALPKLNESPASLPFKSIYMVGDNPLSDIAGANACGWESILLRTGVYTDEQWPVTKHRPTVGVFDNVGVAVDHVLKN